MYNLAVTRRDLTCHILAALAATAWSRARAARADAPAQEFGSEAKLLTGWPRARLRPRRNASAKRSSRLQGSAQGGRRVQERCSRWRCRHRQDRARGAARHVSTRTRRRLAPAGGVPGALEFTTISPSRRRPARHRHHEGGELEKALLVNRHTWCADARRLLGHHRAGAGESSELPRSAHPASRACRARLRAVSLRYFTIAPTAPSTTSPPTRSQAYDKGRRSGPEGRARAARVALLHAEMTFRSWRAERAGEDLPPHPPRTSTTTAFPPTRR